MIEPNYDQTTDQMNASRAALARIKKLHDYDPHLTDDDSVIICSNEIADEAQMFLRDNLDLNGVGVFYDADEYHKHLPRDFAQKILDDLALIWECPYYRGELSELAMAMSLCPMHFCDWAACFDDETEECSQIRAIFPHNHDT